MAYICLLFQIILTRLQKEKDTFQEDCEKLQERLEFQQNQLIKAQRDRENMATELEVVKERWEKTQQNQQKVQVIARRKLGMPAGDY